MAFDITKPAQDTLTPEEKTWLDAQLKAASDAAIAADVEARKKRIPEKYDFKFADKTPLDKTADAEKIAAAAKTLGLTPEQAQAFFGTHEEIANAVIARREEQRKQKVQTWKADVQNDKDLGGSNAQSTMTNIKRAMDWIKKQLPQSKFVEFVEETGDGDHPEFVRVFNAIGKAMAEDGTTGGRFIGGGDKKEDHEIVYGKKTA